MMNIELMVNNRKKWMVIAAILTGAGVLFCTISSAILGFSFKKLGFAKYVTNTYNVSESFENINIKGDTENISFVLAEDGNCKVVCSEDEKNPHDVRVENNTLMIDRTSNSKLQLNIGISTESPEIIVYLSQKEYEILTIDTDTGDIMIPKDFSFESMNIQLDTGDISNQASANESICIKTDTGDITVSDVSAVDMKLTSDTGRMEISNIVLTGNFDLSEQTGKVTMENVSCKKFTSNGTTGSLIMTNVIAAEEFQLKRDTGNIEFNGCDAETIYAKTTTGDVRGTLLSEKVFITETDTGNIDVPKTIAGGKCEITTDTGDINIKIQ
ncbi:MAG: DUF4097 family beta strand repeat protein [Oscillospiraceae bacterium]|nr:DUF4097 family beta strand repeat protein [Oscillospiraceae bacterium]